MNSTLEEVCQRGFRVNGNTIEFHPKGPSICTKQIAKCESTTEENSFEWPHHRISYTDSNQNYVQIKQYHAKVRLKRFHLNGSTIEFHPRFQKVELRSKQLVPSESILLKRFHLNCNTIEFHPRSEKEELCTKQNKIVPHESRTGKAILMVSPQNFTEPRNVYSQNDR